MMIERADLRDNERLIGAVATSADLAAWVMGSTNWRNEQLITTIIGNPACAAEVLIARPDLRTDERLIAAVADSPRWATAVVCETQHRDPRLIHAIARDPMRAAQAAIMAGLRDDVIMESIARSNEATIQVVALTDTEDERLIQIVASDPHAIRRVMKRRPKVRAAIAAAVRARSASKPRNQATHRDNPPDAGETGSQQMPQ